MAEVSFIGLGDMGFALANTAAKSGREIVVWNRTKDKALPLVDGNVTVASTPAEAISASPMTVVCVSDYKIFLCIQRYPIWPHLSTHIAPRKLTLP